MSMQHHIDLSHIQEGLELCVYADNADLLFENTDTNLHEARYQIKEGCTYDFAFEISNSSEAKFDLSNYSLSCPYNKTIVKVRKNRRYEGVISPNIYVGTLQLQVSCESSGKHYPIELEVQSVKTTYRQDYRKMLSDIAEKCVDLILQSSAPTHQSITIDPTLDAQSLYQRFAFIKSMILSEEFELSIHQIIQNPSTARKNESRLMDVRSLKRISSKQTRALIQGSKRMSLPNNHSLRERYQIDSIATSIEGFSKTEHLDTNENRFIKHALQNYLHFCEELTSHPKAAEQLKKEAKQVIEALDNYLQDHFFKQISRPRTLNLNSPLLQRKSGYREQLKIWLQFDLAAKLIWEGGEDVYSGGQKDIATLYEYWLFFKLIELVQKVFHVESSSIQNMFKSSNKGIDLQLKQGDFNVINAVYTKGKRDLQVTLSYNKSFSNKVKSTRKDQGSWTVPMRPDYTLSIWPKEISIDKAEEEEQVVHIHFDAKYKIANLKDFLNGDQNYSSDKTEEEVLNEQKDFNKKGMYKNGDLLKMHAYKDAIKRTGGAYVLYPGTEHKKLEGFHEILPGLGAFSVSPNSRNETDNLEDFLILVLEHFQNRASQRENIAHKTYQITKEIQKEGLNEPIPEYVNGEKLIPDDTYVLVGYYKDQSHLDWIEKRNLYNFRMNNNRGALKLNYETFNAKYLLLHTSGDKYSKKLYKIVRPEYRVTNKETLVRLGYNKPSQPSYLVVKLQACNDAEFKDVLWDFRNLKNYKSGRASAIPFTVSLRDFLNSKKL